MRRSKILVLILMTAAMATSFSAPKARADDEHSFRAAQALFTDWFMSKEVKQAGVSKGIDSAKRCSLGVNPARTDGRPSFVECDGVTIAADMPVSAWQKFLADHRFEKSARSTDAADVYDRR